MNREKFGECMAQARATREDQLLVNFVGVVIVLTVATTGRWPGRAVLDMLEGVHGPEVASAAWRSAVSGCRPAMPVDGRAKPDTREPFAYWCMRHGRLDLLGDVARLGLPAEQAPARHLFSGATTPAGLLLDRMSGWNDTVIPGNPQLRRSFVRLLGSDRWKWPQSTVVAGVQLLLELDPAHPEIAAADNMHLQAMFVEQQMQARLVAAALPALVTAAPVRARRAGL